MKYNFVNSWGVACDLAQYWERRGYASLWVRSDGRVIPSRKMIGNGDDFRTEGGPSPYQKSARRVALTNKKESGRAIVRAIQAGVPIPELCTPGKLPFRNLSPAPSPAPQEIVAIPVLSEYACPVCNDPVSFCDCDTLGLIGRRAA